MRVQLDADLRSIRCQGGRCDAARVFHPENACYGRRVPPVYDRVLRFIDDPAADRFEPLALAVFAHQFASNPPYQDFCRAHGHTPETVTDWRAIPTVPIVAFKHAQLCCGAPVRTFLSSGTTEGAATRSRHALPDLRLYRQSALVGLREFLFPDVERMRLVSLIPPIDEQPDSSLAQMAAWAMEVFGDEKSVYAADRQTIALDTFVAALRATSEKGRPLCILTTTAALIRVLDDCRNRGMTFRLPHGSRLMDTGGDKGAPRPVSRNGLLHAVWNALAIPGYFVANEYGMAELSSQHYDSVIADRVHGRHRPRRKLSPHWARAVVVDPDTVEAVPDGTPGLLCHYDLANAGSVMAVRSEDMGRRDGDGFQLLGRAPRAESRGCSLGAPSWVAA